MSFLFYVIAITILAVLSPSGTPPREQSASSCGSGGIELHPLARSSSSSSKLVRTLLSSLFWNAATTSAQVTSSNYFHQSQSREPQQQALFTTNFLPTVLFAVGARRKYRWIGSYTDSTPRALNFGPKNYGYTVETCFDACQGESPPYRYSATQDSGWCSCSNDYSSVVQYGAATCGPGGAGWCNYVVERYTETVSAVPTQTGLRYRMFSEPSNIRFADAHQKCVERGGWLASVPDQEAWEQLKRDIGDGSGSPPYGSACYIGGSDKDTENTWKWVYGPRAGETFYTGRNGEVGGSCVQGQCDWAPSEPNNYNGNEDYMTLWNDWQWNDQPDNDARFYLCEFLAPGFVTKSSSETKKWRRYRFFRASSTSTQANFQSTCEQEGGNLATIRDSNDYDEFAEDVGNDVRWTANGAVIAGKILPGNSGYEWRYSKDKIRRWMFANSAGTCNSGGQTFCNWRTSQPSTQIVMRVYPRSITSSGGTPFGWGMAADNSGTDFICEFERSSTVTAMTASTSQSDAFQRYIFYPHNRASLSDAMNGCQSRGGWLASIPSLEAKTQLYDDIWNKQKMAQLSGAREALIGGKFDTVRNEWYWVAGPNQGKYFSSDDPTNGCYIPGTPKVCNWVSGKLCSSTKAGCASYPLLTIGEGGTDTWNDLNSGHSEIVGYICEFSTETHEATSTNSWPAVGFERYKYFVAPRKSVTEYASLCEGIGGWLATVPDQASSNELLRVIRENGKGQMIDASHEVVIGLRYDGSYWTWGWGPMAGADKWKVGMNTGQCFQSYCNWRSGHSGAGGGDIYATLWNDNGVWNDQGLNDNDFYGYACEFAPSHTVHPTATQRPRFILYDLGATVISQEAAYNLCRGRNGYLASFAFANDLRQMQEEIGRQSLIGSAWIGGRKMTGDVWRWYYGTPAARSSGPFYTGGGSSGTCHKSFATSSRCYWSPGEPNNSGESMHLYGTDYPTDRQWKLDDTAGDRSKYICEFELDTPTVSASQVTPSGLSRSFSSSGISSTPSPIESASSTFSLPATLSQSVMTQTPKTSTPSFTRTFSTSATVPSRTQGTPTQTQTGGSWSQSQSMISSSKSSTIPDSNTRTILTPSDSQLSNTKTFVNSATSSVVSLTSSGGTVTHPSGLSKTLPSSSSSASNSSSKTSTRPESVTRPLSPSKTRNSFSQSASISLWQSWLIVTNLTAAVKVQDMFDPSLGPQTLLIALGGGEYFDHSVINPRPKSMEVPPAPTFPKSIAAAPDGATTNNSTSRKFLVQSGGNSTSSPDGETTPPTTTSSAIVSGVDMTHCITIVADHPFVKRYLPGNVTATSLNETALIITFAKLPGNETELAGIPSDQSARLDVKPSCLKQRVALRTTNFTFIKVPEPEVTELEVVIKDTQTVVNSIRSLPGVAAAGARSGLILTLIECQPEFFTRLSWSQNPFGLAIGSPKYGHYLAATIFNHILTLGIAGLHFAFAVAYAKCYRLSIAEATARVRCPSLTIIPLLAFLEPTCMSAAVVIIYGENFGIKFIGVFSEVLCFAYVIGMFIYLRKSWAGVFIPGQNPSEIAAKKVTAIEDDDDPEAKEAKWKTFLRRLGAWISYFVDGNVKWKDADPINSKGYCRRNRLLFMDFTGKWYWFMCAELLVAAICGLLDGIKLGVDQCNGIIISLVLVLLIFFVAVCICRPYNAPFLMLFSLVLTGMQLLAAVLMGISMLWKEESLQEWAEWLTLMALYVIIGRAFFDIAPKLKQVVMKLVKKCIRKKKKNFNNVDLTEQLLSVVREDNVENQLAGDDPFADDDGEAEALFPEYDYGDAAAMDTGSPTLNPEATAGDDEEMVPLGGASALATAGELPEGYSGTEPAGGGTNLWADLQNKRTGTEKKEQSSEKCIWEGYESPEAFEREKARRAEMFQVMAAMADHDDRIEQQKLAREEEEMLKDCPDVAPERAAEVKSQFYKDWSSPQAAPSHVYSREQQAQAKVDPRVEHLKETEAHRAELLRKSKSQGLGAAEGAKSRWARESTQGTTVVAPSSGDSKLDALLDQFDEDGIPVPPLRDHEHDDEASLSRRAQEGKRKFLGAIGKTPQEQSTESSIKQKSAAADSSRAAMDALLDELDQIDVDMEQEEAAKGTGRLEWKSDTQADGGAEEELEDGVEDLSLYSPKLSRSSAETKRPQSSFLTFGKDRGQPPRLPFPVTKKKDTGPAMHEGINLDFDDDDDSDASEGEILPPLPPLSEGRSVSETSVLATKKNPSFTSSVSSGGLIATPQPSTSSAASSAAESRAQHQGRRRSEGPSSSQSLTDDLALL